MAPELGHQTAGDHPAEEHGAVHPVREGQSIQTAGVPAAVQEQQ